MLVHLHTWYCTCCGTKVDNTIVDLPIEDIKLSTFPVACSCGYFYKAEHYPVSFDKWRIETSMLKERIKDVKFDLELTQNVKEDLGLIDYRKRNTNELETLLEDYEQRLESLSVPIPDHLFVD